MTTQLTRPLAPRAAARAKRGRGTRTAVQHGHSRAAVLFLSPWVLGVLLLTLGPMLYSLYLSFTDYDLLSSPHWTGLANYRRMLTDPQYLQSARVTLLYVVLAVPLQLLLALAVALALNRRRRGTGFYRAAFYAPSLLGVSVSVALVWRSLFTTGGSVDRLLSALGLHLGGWLDHPRYALYAVVLLSVWQFGAPMVVFLAGLKQIPQELYDAAAVDGAGRWRTFRSVTLPLLSPVVFFNLVLQTIHAFQAFTPAYVMSGGRGGPSGSLLFYTLYLYQRGFSDFRMGYASAMAWVLLLAIAAVTALLFRTARYWVFFQDGQPGGGLGR